LQGIVPEEKELSGNTIHIVFLFFILIGMLGFAVLCILFFSFLKYRHRGWLFFLLLQFVLFLLFNSEILELYGWITDIPGLSSSSLFSVALYKILEQLIWILLPLFLMELFSYKFPAPFWVLLALSSCLFPLSLLPELSSASQIYSISTEILFYSAMAGWSVWGMFQLRKHHSLFLRKYAWIPGIAVLITIPMILIDDFIIRDLFQNLSIPFFLFYMLWNILLLAGLQKRFFSEKWMNHLGSAVDSFCEGYNITDREKEIIRHIIQGMTNKEIAFIMGIAEKTVKNHSYSIYRKAGVQSRILLFLKIQARL